MSDVDTNLTTIVAGSRSVTDQNTVEKAIQIAPITITELVSGSANGVDTCAETWAEQNNIPIKTFPVTQQDYNEKGKRAPLDRNEEMVEYADALIAVWDGKSTGTKHIIEHARKKNLRTFVHHTETISLNEF